MKLPWISVMCTFNSDEMTHGNVIRLIPNISEIFLLGKYVVCLLSSKLHNVASVWEILIVPLLNSVHAILRCLWMNQHFRLFIACYLMCSHDAFNFSLIIQPSLSSSHTTTIDNVAIMKNYISREILLSRNSVATTQSLWEYKPQ